METKVLARTESGIALVADATVNVPGAKETLDPQAIRIEFDVAKQLVRHVQLGKRIPVETLVAMADRMGQLEKLMIAAGAETLLAGNTVVSSLSAGHYSMQLQQAITYRTAMAPERGKSK